MTKKKTQTMTLMCGLPRSGKSTWIRKNCTSEVIVSPDQIRAKIFGHQFHSNSEGFIWAFAEAMAKLLLEQGKDIIIDATNITYESRSTWINIASTYGAKVKIVFFRTSMKSCKRRNEKSDAGNKLPEKVIDNMAIWFEDPVYGDEDDIEVIHVGGRKISQKEHFSGLLRNYYVNDALKLNAKAEIKK